MRILLLLCLLCLTLPGCQGASGLKPLAADNPAASFQLPSPQQLDSLASFPQLPGPPRSVSRLARQTGDLFQDALPHPHVVADDLAYTAQLAGDSADPSFCIYRLAAGVFGPGQFITGIYPELEWDGGSPPSGRGLYLGFADYGANSWRWIAAFTTQTTWLDTTSDNLEGRSGNNFIAVVNYSDHSATLNALNLRFTHFDEDGDEWIYYSHFDPANPGFRPSLSRIAVDGGTVEPILAGDADNGYTLPRIANVGGGAPQLVYRQETAAAAGMYRIALDGTPPATLLQESPLGLYPGGWDPTGKIYLWTEDSGSGLFNLHADNSNVPESGRLSRDLDDVRDAVWDPSREGVAYAALFAIAYNEPTDRSYISGIATNDSLPADRTPSTVVDNGTETAIQPAPYTILNGLGGVSYGFLFASKDRDDSSYNLYRFSGLTGDSTSTLGPVLIDSGQDLTSPVLSPNAGLIAFIAAAPGADRGTLYVMDSVAGNLGNATALAENVTGQLAWYDPTP